MKRLLRILFTVRGLILAGTLALAIFGSYLAREAAPSATEMKSHPASQVQVLDGSQIQPLSLHDACAQPGYGKMILCPLWH
jgi:hypothetical protein